MDKDELQSSADVLIVSVFGRGHWLAAELARKGIPVCLIDVSHLMGPWPVDESEGPFGFFKSDSVSEGQLESLQQGLALRQIDSGFSLWLKSGPLAFRSPVFTARQKALGIADSCVEFLRGGIVRLKKQSMNDWVAKFETQIETQFEKQWPAYFAQSWARTEIDSMGQGDLSSGKKTQTKSPLFDSFYVRPVQANTLEKSLDWLRNLSQGLRLQVHSQAEIHDVSFSEKKMVSGLEVKIQRQEVFHCEKLVWCLSSQETAKLSPKLQEALFSQGIVAPEWFWSKFEIRRHSSSASSSEVSDLLWKQVPEHCVILDDEFLPWTHANMVVLQKDLLQTSLKATGTSEKINLWLRLPIAYRFQKQPMEEIGQALLRLMRQRFPFSQFSILDWPQEMNLSAKELGPTRHPIFGEKSAKQRQTNKFKNVHLDSPETWPKLGCDGMWSTQSIIMSEVSAWWAHKEELRLKRLAKEEARQRKNEARKNEVDL